eukprot:s508_g14.t3
MFWGHNLATHSPSHFQAEQQAALEEAKEASKALERQRSMALTELNGLVARGAMPWLWLSDPTGWQQVAGACSDGGFFALDSAEALKGKDTRQAAQQCIAAPLLQEGQQHSNLLVATVSKLLHGLRGVEGTAAFAADCLLQAHSTPLPRLFLVELTQHCTAQELTSQGAFQRSLAAFLVALSERLPHVVLANISVLLPLLDVDCYPIRQAIVESIGHLLSAEGRKLPSGAHNAQQEETDGTVADPEAEIAQSSSGIFTLAPATKNDLLETLFTRFLDKSVWVRYRVLQTLNNLASNNGLPRELWPRVLDLAIRRMQDTASMSRKAAMQLVRKLVEFHPYGPALKGSGDERAKTTKLLNEIQDWQQAALKQKRASKLDGAMSEASARAPAAKALDACFVMDCTTSMRNVIGAAKENVSEIQRRICNLLGHGGNVRFAIVAYRDHQNDFEQVSFFLSGLEAGGTFNEPLDVCEDVIGGLNEAMKLEWPGKTRILYLLCDDPPHGKRFADDCVKEAIDKQCPNDNFDLNPDDASQWELTDNVLAKSMELQVNLLVLKYDRPWGPGATCGKMFDIFAESWMKAAITWADRMKCPLWKSWPLHDAFVTHLRVVGLTSDPQRNTVVHKLHIRPEPFAEGAMRYAFPATSENGRRFVLKARHVFSIVLDLQRFAEHKVHKFGLQGAEKECLSDVQTQAYAKFFGEAFAQRFPDAPIQFLDSWQVELLGCPIGRHATLEPFLEGKYQKYTNNSGFIAEGAKLAEAFSHFTFCHSGGQMMVTDLQGFESSIFTDPQIHCVNKEFFGRGNLGSLGMDECFLGHSCNEICAALKLKPHPMQMTLDEENTSVGSGSSASSIPSSNHGSQICELCGALFKLRQQDYLDAINKYQAVLCAECGAKVDANKLSVPCVSCSKEVYFSPYTIAIKGCAKPEKCRDCELSEQWMFERMKKLKAEELAELEGADAGDADGAEDAAEPPEKRQKRCKGKTETDVSIAREVDKDLEANGEAGAEDAGESASARHAAREKQREALQRMQQCYAQRVHFVELLDAAEARLRGLLSSKTATDVTEAISVVVELRLRGVPAAARAFHQVLGLVWSRHGPIKDAAVDAFYRMHLEGRDTASAAEAVLQIYKDGFSSGELTHTHLASVQELIQQAAEKELIVAAEVIPKMVSALGDGRAAGALRALTALSATGHDALAKNALPKVQEFICRSSCSPAEQLEHARLVAQLLLRFLGSAKGAVNDAAVSRLCAVSQQCSYLVVQHFVKGEVPPQWFPAAMCAMDLSFELAQHGSKALDAAHRSPDKVWENILNRMLCGILGGQGDGNENGEVEVRKVQVPQLGCVAFVAGHLALRMLIFLEGLQSALKRQRLAQEEAKIAEQREKSKEKKASKKGKGAKAAEEDEDKAETSMGGVGLEEREAEAFAQIAETGLLYSNRLLDRVKPLLFACLLDKELRGYPLIRRVGAISLCKFMTVSKRFCEENLQLLFSVLFPKNGKGQLQGATQEAIAEGGLLEDLTLRQSLLVAVGDLLFRHPNVVEPWTGRLYSTLSTADASGNAVDLRLTALLVLTHLVLNDMMKPRPVLLIRALWLTACNHEATARVARILFQELAKRSTNVVYNLLPEIVARLPEHVEDGVEGGAVARVQYIMQFVEKEKHIEGLIEKFTLRLEQCASGAGGEVAAEAATQEEGEGKTAKVEDTVSCLAHALGAMNYSDRCILRLHDVVVTRKALNLALSYYPVARECLLAVVEKARKPRGKGEDGDAKTAAAAAPAEGEGKASGAAQAALDAMEQLVNTLAHGKEEMEIPATAPVPATAQRKNDAAKRKNAEAEEPGFEEEKKPRKGKGRGRGRADKELSQLLTLASRSSKSQQTSNDLLFKGSFNGFPNLFGTSSSRCFSYLFSASNGQPNGAKNEAVAEKPVAEKPKGRKRRVKADQDDDDYE